MSDREIIARYMAGVIRAQDGRGAARNESELYRALVPNTTPTIARMTAAACRAVGEFIKSGPRGSAAISGAIDDDEGNSGRARRLAGASGEGSVERGRHARVAVGRDGASEHGAGLLRAQPSGTGDQGNDDAATGANASLTGRAVGESISHQAAR